MKFFEGSRGFPPGTETSLTIGNFDGVHLGHRELLRRTVAHARELGSLAVVLTFSPHPIRFFSPKARFYEITSTAEKAERMEELGIDAMVVESFDGEIGGMAPEEFARTVVRGRLGARFVTVGYDFTFGKGRTGSPEMLSRLGVELGFSVDVVPPLLRDGAIVSSSRIRDLLLGGRVREAEALLRRPYKMSGTVVMGASRGRKLGFPTANVQFAQELVPLPGVYVVDVDAGLGPVRGVANVGFNPTFGENSLGLEVHLLDFDGDLYGRELTVWFRDRIRDERKFQSAEELVRQIRKDVKHAREARVPRRGEFREPSRARGRGAGGR